ncbi:MAG TPA: hypothetical protein VN634_14175 [Candidatus Limnocylindrales bacterium]|nr:hypothetical protein [Candidatus Limnocylindrales bacterium]
MKLVPTTVQEIEKDPALRIYGAILAATNCLAFVHWTWFHPIAAILRPNSLAVCWPFLQDCEWMRVLDPPALTGVLAGWLALSVVAAALFLRRSTCRWAWLLLVVALVVKQWLIFGDYRLRLNQHYMALWVTAAFLFIPHRRRVLPYLVTFFYGWAALLKFSPEWLSGQWTYGRTPLGMPDALVPAASVYVLVLELVLVWGLTSRRAWLFWLTFGQLLLFHLASWNVVGFFYPMLMFGILALFPLLRLIPPERDAAAGQTPEEHPVGLPSLLSGGEPRAVVLTLAAFSLLQLLPLLLPGDTAVTGEGRWISLHMFDAPVHCSGALHFHDASGSTRDQAINVNMLILTERMRCDPIVYFSVARMMCRMNRERPKFADIGLTLSSGRKGHDERPVVSIDRFCETAPRYEWWHHNDWIAAGS